MLLWGCWKMGCNKVEAFIGMLLLLLDGHLLYKPFPYTDKDLVLFSLKINTNIERGCVERVSIMSGGENQKHKQRVPMCLN